MKRRLFLHTLVLAGVLAAAPAASAAVVVGTRAGDMLPGTPSADKLFAGWGADTLSGGDGDDVLFALARDGMRDTVDCGDGAADTAYVRAEDQTTNCETVVTVTPQTLTASEE